MTSTGVFPNTLAAPATAPNSPVITGLMYLLGSSPWHEKKKKTYFIKWHQGNSGRFNKRHLLTHLCTSSSEMSWRRSGWPGWSPASVQWLWGPDKSPSDLRGAPLSRSSSLAVLYTSLNNRNTWHWAFQVHKKVILNNILYGNISQLKD